MDYEFERDMPFAVVYNSLFETLMDSCNTNITCRGMQMAKEIVAARLDIGMSPSGVSVFSHPTHRVVPIRFVLAELCHILAGRNDVSSLQSYNKGMVKYSNDGITLGGAYGERLHEQLDAIMEKLQRDPSTRQACAVIFQKMDMLDVTRVHIPCNVFLQIIYREPLISMIVTSRSSDFVTGFSIDTIHWQFLLKYIANDLGPNVVANRLHYNLGSLHIYKDDISVIEKWDVTQMYNIPYQHFLQPTIGLHEAQWRCKKGFRENLSIQELGELLGLDESSIKKCEELAEYFKLYKNELKR